MIDCRLILLLLSIFFSNALRASDPICLSWGGADGFGIWGENRATMRVENSSNMPFALKCPFPTPASRFIIASRVLNLHAQPDKAYRPAARTNTSPFHGLRLTSASGDTIDVMLAMHRVESLPDWDDVPLLKIRIVRTASADSEETITLNELRNMAAETTLRLSAHAGSLTVEVGTSALRQVWTKHGIVDCIDTMAILLAPGAAVQPVGGALLCYPQPYSEMLPDCDAAIHSLQFSRDASEGEWIYLDRTLDEQLLRLGGRYRLLTLRNDKGGYNIYYLSGAEVRPTYWRKGMLKGCLLPDGNGRYILQWRDADGEWMTHHLSATLEETDILSLLFPYQSSTIRFRKIN